MFYKMAGTTQQTSTYPDTSMKKFYLFLFTLCITQIVLLQKAGAQCAKPVIISKAATVCPGGTTTLFTKQDPSLSYTWSNGANTASITAGAGTYTLTTTDGVGCSQTSDPVIVKEKALPPVIPSDTPVLCSGQTLTLYSDTGNIWVRKPDFPAAAAVRTEGVSFSIGSKGYIGAGTCCGNVFHSDLWEYDEATETWSQKADIPGSGGRVFATGIAINNKGYVGLGHNATTTFSDWYEFDPFANTWTAKANYPGGGTRAAAGFAVGNMGYVGLGRHSSGTYPLTFWTYNPATDTWTSIASFPGTGRREPVAFSINNKGYVATGWLLGGANNANDCWQYDPASNTWLAQANLPGQGRRTATAFTIQDHAYIVCGYINVIGATNELWEFYNGAWTKKTSFSGNPQWGPNAFGLHDKAIVCLGSAGNRQVWEYHPNNTVQWPNGSTQLSYTVNTPASYSATIRDIEGCAINTSPLTVTAANFTTPPIRVSSGSTICEGATDTLFAGGDVWTKKSNFPGGSSRYASGFTLGSTGYYCGGSNGTQFWKYDPATDTWAQQASMPMNVGSSPAIAWNGKGWVLGTNKTMYMYNPIYNTWIKKATFPGSAYNVQSGFLLNNKLIVAGGINATGQVVAEVWEYDLVNDIWSRKNDMPFAMGFAPSFALNGKGYVITGNSTRNNAGGPQSADCLQYDPATDSWTVMADFPGGPRGGGIGFTDGHKGYVGMGNHGPILTDLWQLDPATLTWTRMTDIPRGRYGTVAMVFGHHAYISTGSQPAGGNVDVWQYEMPYNYQWSTGETTRYIKVTQTGDYSVQVRNDEGCSVTTPAVHITVQPKTVISTPPQHVTICDASPTGFSVNASGTNITYQWQLNGSNINDGSVYGGTTTNALSVANVNGLGTGQFQCVVTGTCGTETSTAATLTVNPLPAKPVITPGSATTFCDGGSVTLASSALSGNTWSNTSTTQNINVTTSGSFSVQVTDGNGCSSPVSDAVTVTVHPLPVKPVITTGGATTFCNGGSVTLTSSVAAGNTWSNGGTSQNNPITASGSYTVQVTDGNGCISRLSDAVLVTVNPLPAQPVITASGPLSFCDGDSVTLSSTAAAACQWSNGSRASAISVNKSGSFTVRVTDNNGCTSPVSDVIAVAVNPFPSGAISSVGPVAAGSSHYFQLTAPRETNGTYAWSTGDRTAATRVTQSGTYRVTVTTANGCSKGFQITVQFIDLTKIPNTFSPNRDGVNDYWTVKALDQFPNALVQIFNRNGNKVFEAKGPGVKWNGTSNGNELPAGVYYYVLDLKDGSQPVNGWLNLVK
jgi:gliding motility-associated-like protein